jgi:hypothetical protein
MRIRFTTLFFVFLIGAGSADAATQATESLLAQLKESAPLPFSASRGRDTWYRQQDDRSCASCHSESVRSPGRHVRTGKFIEPMAPSVNRMRLTRVDKMQKWLLRNCQWTFGRACTAQEQGDMLVWLSAQ